MGYLFILNVGAYFLIVPFKIFPMIKTRKFNSHNVWYPKCWSNLKSNIWFKKSQLFKWECIKSVKGFSFAISHISNSLWKCVWTCHAFASFLICLHCLTLDLCCNITIKTTTYINELEEQKDTNKQQHNGK